MRAMAKEKSKDPAKEKSRGREVVGILLLMFAIIYFLALVTHNEEDWPGSSRAFGEPVKNLIGKYGAAISHWTLQFIGMSGYFLAAFLLIAGVIVFMHRGLRPLVKAFFFMGVLGVFMPLLASLTLQAGSETAIPETGANYGGVFGMFASYEMIIYFGRTGAILVSIGVILVDLVLSTTITPSTIVEYCWNGVKGLWVSLFGGRKKSRDDVSLRKAAANTDDDDRPDLDVSDEDNEGDGDGTPFLIPPDEEEEEPPRPAKPMIAPVITLRTPARAAIKEPEEEEEEDEPGYDETGFDFESEEDAEEEEEPAGESNVSAYVLPTSDLLDVTPDDPPSETREELLEKAQELVESLRHFNIETEVRQITPGPIVTRYELTLAPGIKVGRVVNLSDDLQLALKARGGIRILAPIPGKAAIGIEVPNKNRSTVYFREIVESDQFRETELPLVVALGKNTAGEPVVADLAKMPHLLIAGSTGSGKSVCINTLIASLLMKATPDMARMIMIDPKVVELSIYNSIPHLLAPVVSDPHQASNVLKWAVGEMESRYRRLASVGVRDISQFNMKLKKLADENKLKGGDEHAKPDYLPYIVVIIDEFADLMVVAANEVEEYIARLAQMARAVGIHLVLATQRPSSDVITGLIKANFPSRIAFKVMQASNSRIILDTNGADKLLGMGDMLFLQVGKPEPIRLHGAYISNDECLKLTEFVSNQTVNGLDTIPEDVFEEDDGGNGGDDDLGMRDPNSRDVLFYKAARIVVRANQGSVSLLQRRLKIGYARAARLIDQLEMAAVVGPYDGSKAREVLVDDAYIDELEAGEL